MRPNPARPTRLPALITAVTLMCLAGAAARTWTSKDGTQTFKARFESYDEADGSFNVTLPNGLKKKFKVDVLSEEDIAFLKSAGSKRTSSSGGGHDIPDELPDPDDQAPDASKPVKVYVLMGQSNMVGFGQVGAEGQKGTLTELTKGEGKFPHLVDDDGAWTVRNDAWCVQVVAGSRKDWLQPGFGAKGNLIGPELGFGHVVGHYHDEMVLIIKATMGNRCLGWDILPPSSYTPEDIEARKPENRKDPWYPGWEYDRFVNGSKEILADLPNYFPEYKGSQGYEIAGFAWWQGHKDQKQEWADAYEKNLVNLINDLRDDFEAPEAKFVLATIAFGGEKLGGHGLTVANAQLAVGSGKGKHKDFAGNVKTIDARPFWRDPSVSPNGQGYHYNHNAETYMLVGDALGRAMVELLEN